MSIPNIVSNEVQGLHKYFPSNDSQTKVQSDAATQDLNELLPRFETSIELENPFAMMQIKDVHARILFSWSKQVVKDVLGAKVAQVSE